MGSAMAVAAHDGSTVGCVPGGSGDPAIVVRLRCEARKPLDLSDLPDEQSLDSARAEVSRLRGLLHDAATDDELVQVSLRPTRFRGVGLPIPADEELRDMLAVQSGAKKVMMAREQARERQTNRR